MPEIGVVGATGYTGCELLRLISLHPLFELSFATSEKFKGMRIGDVFPSLVGSKVEDVELVGIEDAKKMRCDGVFLALPHEVSSKEAGSFLKNSPKVVDLSAAFRMKDLSVYERFYGKHWSPELLSVSAYGIPEIFREEVKKARIVANPGCYPTSVIIPLYPLVKKGLIKGPVFVDSKSGVSGAGREPSLGTLFSEVNESMKPYKTGVHRHQPEMEEQLGIKLLFSPHLAPMDRGILSSIYIAQPPKEEDVYDAWEEFYEGAPFVKVLKGDVSTKGVRGTNFIHMTYRLTERGGVVFSAIDNLTKGASGQAIQNMNVALGLEETLGLEGYALFP